MKIKINILLFTISIFFLINKNITAKPAAKIKKVDICVYGGTSAGVIAAYAAKMLDKSVILVEDGTHPGGLSSGGLGATDIGNKYAITGLARNFYRRMGDHYGKFEQWNLEPSVAEQVFQQYINEANVEVIYNKRINHVLKDGKSIKMAVFEDSRHPSNPDSNLAVKADMFLDCSYVGDLMARAGVSYTVGRESNEKYNETYNGVQMRDRHQFNVDVDPYVIKGDPTSGLLWGINPIPKKPDGTGDRKVQAYNYRLCLTKKKKNQVPITKPESYDAKKYALLERLIKARNRENWIHYLKLYLFIREMPNGKTDVNNMGPFSTDMIGENWNYPEASYKEREKISKKIENYTKGLLYFLSNNEVVPNKVRKKMQKYGWCADEFTDNGNFPHELYVRESRRMVGEYVMTQHNCTGKKTIDDGIGMAAYTMDSHNCDRHVVNGKVKNEGNVEVAGFDPYPISYRSLVPKKEECDNLLVPVCLSASHIAYGSIRMEPVFMVLGQSAAMGASQAIDNNKSVQNIEVSKLQKKLKKDPLLDGSTPEILVDDVDKVEYKGSWNKKPEIDGVYGPSCHIAENNNKKNEAIFKPVIKKSGSYKILYYCTDLSDLKDQKIAKKVKVSVKNNGKSSSKSINIAKNQENWIDIGNYHLKKGDKIFINVNATGNDPGIISADAVLLIPQF